MLTKIPLVAFIATARPDESRHFYAQVLGLREVEDTPFAVVFEAHGTTLRIQKVAAVSPPPYTVLGWEVEDIDGTVADLVDKGVEFERFEALPQDEAGTWAAPDGTRVAWFKDPDGQLLSVSQPARLG